MPQVKIVGSEAICGSGLNKTEIFSRCVEQKTAVLENGLAPIDQQRWQFLADYQPDLNLISRCSQASFFTLQKALENAHWDTKDTADCGFIFASTTSQIDQWQNSLPFCYSKNLDFDQITEATKYQSLGITLIELQQQFHIHGPSTVIASSCSASLQALSIAYWWIKSGLVKRCIVGTTEVLSDLTINGFNSLRLLTKGPCKPFDLHRSGINLGEASAFLCLEADDLSDRPAQGFIAGAGLSTDAYHPTSPDPHGQGSYLAMSQAFQCAQLSVSDLDWVHAHGTGSSANDQAESQALQRLLVNPNTPVTSTKSIHGHTLGACGGLETVLLTESLKHNIALPTAYTQNVDPKIGLNILMKPLEKELNVILKNSLGFGGINCSLVLTKSRLS